MESVDVLTVESGGIVKPYIYIYLYVQHKVKCIMSSALGDCGRVRDIVRLAYLYCGAIPPNTGSPGSVGGR